MEEHIDPIREEIEADVRVHLQAQAERELQLHLQEQCLLEYITRPELPEDIQEQLNTYYRLVESAVAAESRIDGNVQEILEHSLAIEQRVYERMGKPPPCIACPRLEKVDRVPSLSEHTCRMEFRCGHSVHTQCFLNYSYWAEMFTTSMTCPVCKITLMEDYAISFFRHQNRQGTPNRILDLWNTNEAFRLAFRDVCKHRRAAIKLFKECHTELQPIIREYKETIHIPIQTLLVHKKEYSKRIVNLVSRRRYISSSTAYMKRLNRFTKEHKIWSEALQALRGIRGVPHFPRRLKLSYRYNISLNRLLRIKRI